MNKKILFFCLIVLLALPVISAAASKEYSDEEKVYIYFDRGEKLFNSKKYSEAVKYYYAAIKLKPDFTDAWKKTAFCYYQLRKHKYAYTAFQKVLKLDPGDKDAKDFTGYYESMVEKKEKKGEDREMIDSLWRAAVLPGWGQFHNKQEIKGFVAGGAFILSAGMAAYSVIDQNVKYDKYINSNENHDIAYREAESAYNSALMWALITAGVYIAGIADAAVSYDNDEVRVFNANISGGSVNISLNLRW